MTARRAHHPASVLRVLMVAGLVVALIIAVFWATGGLAGLDRWAAERQRDAQAVMAGALRRLRAGEPGATAALLAVCFGYGFVHAVGPGHGKLLIGGYGYGTRVPARRLAVLAVLSSLAQALTAVALVWGGIVVLNLSRETLTDLTEEAMADVSAALIGLIGLWLAWRGMRMLWRSARAGQGDPADHSHHHAHDHDADCGCGHAHGPTVAEAAATRSLRDALVLIAGIAARPCTGALFLLILAWRMGIFGTGVAGALAMGLGTATVSLAVALLAVWARQGSLALAPSAGPLAAMARWLPGIMQIAAGCVVALVALSLLA